MAFAEISIWKKAPLLRLLIPFMAGIIIQGEFSCSPQCWLPIVLISLIFFSASFFLSFFIHYKFGVLIGLCVAVMFTAIGGMVTGYSDIRNSSNWFDKYYNDDHTIMVTLAENPVEKIKSLKADATVNSILLKDEWRAVKGKMILYFIKDSSSPPLAYGSQIIIKKVSQKIKSSGNPGSFDYKRYCLFQQLTHEVYLRPGEYIVLNKKKEPWLSVFISHLRHKVLNIIPFFIRGEKEKGLAEALLIGYKNDLDKTLVQSYTRTGVVHIIAISGMHLGLIYGLLMLLSSPLQRKKNIKWLKPVIVLAGLWIFSLVAGAQPSVLRSAVMFSCITVGDSMGRRSSIFNSLAASSFLLLLYNPFWLWDAGFQLSYAAVLSIIIFMQPVYDCIYIKNKFADYIWKLNAVTISAQILTVPVSIYHFHQFPNFFLLTNLVAVPLSSLIVLGEILLCLISFATPLAVVTGKILQALIWFMNTYIEGIESLPYSLWDGLQISIIQTTLLILMVPAICFWLSKKRVTGLFATLACLFCFILLRSISFIRARDQQKIIVYNVPKQRAIDLIEGRKSIFIGDDQGPVDDFISGAILKPSRIRYRISEVVTAQTRGDSTGCFTCAGKHILLIDRTRSFQLLLTKESVDLLILSKNADVFIPRLAGSFLIGQVVFDGSAPPGKIRRWKRDCDSLHIPNHDVNEKGAFVMNLR